MENNTTITNDELARMIASGFSGVDVRLDKIDGRLDRIENFLLEDHRKRIERLEVEMKELRGVLALK